MFGTIRKCLVPAGDVWYHPEVFSIGNKCLVLYPGSAFMNELHNVLSLILFLHRIHTYLFIYKIFTYFRFIQVKILSFLK